MRPGLLVATLTGPLAALALGAAGASAGDDHVAGSPQRVRRERAAVVEIPSGEFVMGASAEQVHAAAALCARELLPESPFAWACAGMFQPQPALGGEPPPALCDPATFVSNDPSAHSTSEYPAHRVWLPAFGIDRTEVTVAAYARCAAWGPCPPAPVAVGTPQLGAPTQPIVGVSWDEAQRYCHWLRGRLPTEAEWERAARGRDRRPFPWGFQYDPRRANHGAVGAYCDDPRDGYAMTAPVGSFPDGASPDGLLDMAGNAWEWVADLWDDRESRYPEQRGARRSDPRGALHGAGHVVRGGGYNAPAFALRTTFRQYQGTGARSLSLGFRCAYER